MDLVEAVRTLIAVADEGSISAGAESLGIPQPTASRRIARLEEEIGITLVERTTRSMQLTTAGEQVLLASRDLMKAVDRFHYDTLASANATLRIVAPAIVSPLLLAAASARARAGGTELAFTSAEPSDRSANILGGEVHAVVLNSEALQSDWSVPLGVAGAATEEAIGDFTLDALRPSRSVDKSRWAKLIVQHHDVGTPWAERLRTFALTSGLVSDQLLEARDAIEGLSHVVGGDALLVCSASEAQHWELEWRPIAGWNEARHFRLEAVSRSVRQRVLETSGHDIGLALGVKQ